MTGNRPILKWSVYVLTLLPVWLLEILLRRIPVFGVFPMLLPLAAVAVAVLEGSATGAGFGLAVGIVCGVVYYGTGGSIILVMTLIGAAVGLVTQYGLRQNFWGYLLCSAGVLALLDATRIVWRLFWGMAPLLPLLKVAVPEVLWSLVFSPLVYLLYRSVHRRVGGTAPT